MKPSTLVIIALCGFFILMGVPLAALAFLLISAVVLAVMA